MTWFYWNQRPSNSYSCFSNSFGICVSPTTCSLVEGNGVIWYSIPSLDEGFQICRMLMPKMGVWDRVFKALVTLWIANPDMRGVVPHIKLHGEFPFVIWDSLTLCNAPHKIWSARCFSTNLIVEIHPWAFTINNAFEGVHYGNMDTCAHLLPHKVSLFPIMHSPKCIAHYKTLLHVYCAQPILLVSCIPLGILH